jgi:integrase
LPPDADWLVGARFHDLRHSAITRLAEHGLSTLELASISGHKSLQMLARYTHIKAEGLAQKLARLEAAA